MSAKDQKIKTKSTWKVGQQKPTIHPTNQGRSAVKSLENYSTFQILLLRNSANIIKFQNHNEKISENEKAKAVEEPEHLIPFWVE